MAALAAFLTERLGPSTEPLTLRPCSGGHSNLTAHVRWANQDLILRRPPAGAHVKGGHDMGREFRLLERLAPVFPLAPRAIAFCEDPAVLDAPFFVMERRAGIIWRRDLPAGIPPGPEAMRRRGERFLDGLVSLHGVDVPASGLSDFGRPEGYVARQVSGWIRRYQEARLEEDPRIEAIASWLDRHQPADSASCLIHNDYKLDNVVWEDGGDRLVAILDWEMAALGDPWMDLGTTLCYWIEAGDSADLQAIRFGPTHLPGCWTREELARAYAERSGRSMPDLTFYYAFGLFKTAVVAQQILTRLTRRGIDDDQSRLMAAGVAALGAQAARVIDSGRLSPTS